MSIAVVLAVVAGLFARAAATVTEDSCRTLVKQLEQTSNMNPSLVAEEAPGILEILRQGDEPVFYYIAYNIYAENLFNQGRVAEAREAIMSMLGQAREVDDAECLMIALRTQGQFYYKSGWYERAGECFRQALETCDDYKKLQSYFSFSSTLFWLVQCDLLTGRLDEGEAKLQEMDRMMTWLESIGQVDRIGYKPVMILGLKARIATARGKLDVARNRLDSCQLYMRDDVPPRAYVEYYVGRMQLAERDGRDDETLALLDTLIDMHIADYKPIAVDFLQRKANLLMKGGNYRDAAEAYRLHNQIKQEVDEVSIAQTLDELRTHYEVESLKQQRDNDRLFLIIVLIVCAFLTVLLVLYFVINHRLTRKNIALARMISRLNQSAAESKTETEADESEPYDERMVEIGRKIVEFIDKSECFLKSDCSRDTIKSALGYSEKVLSKSLPAVTGMSFVAYINELRLKRALNMLENMPEMTVAEIGNASGFGSVRQFLRIFKQKYALTPTAYRDAYKRREGE